MIHRAVGVATRQADRDRGCVFFTRCGHSVGLRCVIDRRHRNRRFSFPRRGDGLCFVGPVSCSPQFRHNGCGGSLEFELDRIDTLGNPQQAHEIIAVTATASGQAGGRFFEHVVKIGAVVEGLDDLLDGAVGQLRFVGLRTGGLGKVG